jgi:hypothetical protein
MIESISTAAAMTIAKIAFDKFIEGGAGELGKKVTEGITHKRFSNWHKQFGLA